MHRRNAIAAGLLVGTAGCLDRVTEGSDDPREGFERSFETTIDDQEAIDLEAVYWEADRFVIEHTTEAEHLSEFQSELGVIAGGVASPKSVHEPEIELVEGESYHPDGSLFGRYEIEPEWIESYADGDLSGSAYAEKVAGTFSHG